MAGVLVSLSRNGKKPHMEDRKMLRKFGVALLASQIIMLVVGLVAAIGLSIAAWHFVVGPLVVKAMKPPAPVSVAHDPVIVALDEAMCQFDGRVKAIKRECEPQIVEALAKVEFYEQKLKEPVPEPTREETLRALDKLWE